ncbi:cellulose binding domain-containing protein [Marinimicrobium locisalis]|uniref:cellulose binding domain-containing protein n=1 Tax=Marinimicrobium locisalis TaxID=546022 RepID=UPI003222203E
MQLHNGKHYALAALLGLGIISTGQASAQAAECQYIIDNEWGSGFTAAVEITNTGSRAIEGWQVNWQYDSSEITNAWNASLSGSNPYSASDSGWNATIQPGQTVSFGFQGVANGGVIETPAVTGDVCSGQSNESSSAPSSSSSRSSSSISSSPTSSSSSTGDSPAGELCNWYGTEYPLCEQTQSGWGWEGQQSCIAPSTCQSQPEPYGVVGDNASSSSPNSSSQPSSSSSSSSSSSDGPTGACGEGDPDARVSGSPGNYQVNGNGVGGNYFNAIRSAIDSLSPGQRVTVFADGSIGDNSIDLPSDIIFEVCGTMDVGNVGGRGAVQAIGERNVSIPYLNMTGSPYFGMRFADVHNLHLGEIDLRLNGGLGIRFERDLPGSTDVTMDYVYVSGTNNHGVETWNVDGLEIGTVVARNVAYAGLLLNNSRNATIDLVDGDNVATGTGYATLRFANENGRINGGYSTNIQVGRVVSRGGGRGIFCVSNSGGVEIEEIDLANNGNNSILLENCHNVRINGGQIDSGGELRIAARSEFPNTSDVTIANLDIVNTNVRESPCGDNINWVNLNVSGGSYNVCN